jgi:hypothetical protein
MLSMPPTSAGQGQRCRCRQIDRGEQEHEQNGLLWRVPIVGVDPDPFAQVAPELRGSQI